MLLASMVTMMRRIDNLVSLVKKSSLTIFFQAQKRAGWIGCVPWYEACQRDAGQGQRLLLEALPRHLQDLQHQLHRHCSFHLCDSFSDWQFSKDCWSYRMSAILWAKRSSAKRIQTLFSSGEYCIASDIVGSPLIVSHFRRHLESSKHFGDWCGKHLTTKKPLDHEMFVSVVTRLNGLYVLVETPQQNTDSGVEGEGGEEVNMPLNDLIHNLEIQD